MVEIGSKIFFDADTGNVLITSPSQIAPDDFHIHSVDELIQIYPVLRDRDRASFDVIELEYGQYTQDFAESTYWTVDPATKKILFTYRDPNNPEVPPTPQPALTEQLTALRTENETLKNRVSDVEMTLTEILFS
ncbi:hypothetical protein [Paenibacillus sp. FSL W7-1332]|uniref:hypothetical protein n=1 Tax=Paenibacillus sp. FSL W7-1332 TaxID=2921702 RepID=UPI0030D60CAC